MGAVDTTYTFTATDTITSTKMNNIIDQTTMTDDAIWLNDGLEVASGKIRITGGGITSSKLGTGCVTSNAILDGTIVNADINASAAIALSKLGSGALPTAITIASANIVDGTIVADDIADATITAPKLNGAQTGSAPIYGVRAWANFDAQSNNDLAGSYSRSGTAVTVTATAHGLIAGNLIFIDFTVGTGTAPFDGLYVVDSVTDANTFTVTSSASTASTGTATLKRKTIRGSGNISCISAAAPSPIIPPTSNDTVANGYYIANFSVSMPNSNFAVFGTCSEDGALSAGSGNDILAGSPYNEKSAFITTISIAGGAIDALHNSVSIIG